MKEEKTAKLTVQLVITEGKVTDIIPMDKAMIEYFDPEDKADGSEVDLRQKSATEKLEVHVGQTNPGWIMVYIPWLRRHHYIWTP
jgi:hypothetical protein